MKIRILYNNFAHKGGSENAIYWLLCGLVERGHDVTLITRYYSDTIWGPRDRFPCPVITLQAKNVSRYFRSFAMPFLVHPHIRDADIINPHNYPASIWAAVAKVLFRLKGRLVYFCQEPNRALHYNKYDGAFPGQAFPRLLFDDKTPKWLAPLQIALERKLDLWAGRRMEQVLVNSDFSKQRVDSVFGVRSIVCTLGEPLDTICHPDRVKRKREYFLAMSRLHPAKNIKTVLAAYKLLYEERGEPFPPLVVAGDGLQFEEFREWCASERLSHKIFLKGYVKDGEIADYMSLAIAFIFVPIREPFGLVTVEAFFNDTPVIVSDEGGPAEVVEEGRTGFRVNPIDPEAVAEKMAWFLDNPEKGREMGARAGAKARVYYSRDAFMDRFADLAGLNA
ncbi:MAG: glycosyltransferase family 4 protein [Fibrobacterota bacterium]